MCGIIGIVGNCDVTKRILSGLKKLEYRGYDSSGISVLIDGDIKTIKKQGKIANLENAISKNKNIISNIGIAHTRWATHGKPSDTNSHPHFNYQISVVHNGIIENYQNLKEKLQNSGYKFITQTDSEVIPHLLSYYLQKSANEKEAVISTLKELEGSFALAIIFKDKPDLMIVAKKGSPLLIGYGEGENFIASDYFALDDLTDKISYLEDGDIAFISRNKVEIFDLSGQKIKRQIKKMSKDIGKITKDGYEHFMLKEIFEQPKVIKDTIEAYLNIDDNSIHLPNFPFDLELIDKVTIVACGTSYYAGMVAKYLIESLSEVNVEVDIASEFRYRNMPFQGKNLVIFISQSGETADSIAALKFVQSKGQKTVAIVNAYGSTMSHLADVTIRTIAGPEIGVASTKAYIAQITVLSLFAIKLGLEKKIISNDMKDNLITGLLKTPDLIDEILAKKSISRIKKIAKILSKYRNILYMGRGISYVTALEGSLKLKELSYINSSGIASGELKHGTIALIDKKLPVIAIAPNNELFDKSSSNIEEITSRDGKVILLSNKSGINKLQNVIFDSIELPEINSPFHEALLFVVPTQLIAYYVAFYKGNDVDQPRNLAKSVTVE